MFLNMCADVVQVTGAVAAFLNLHENDDVD